MSTAIAHETTPFAIYAPMSDEQVIAALTWCREHEFPHDAVRAVLAEPDRFIEPLLTMLRMTPDELDKLEPKRSGEVYYGWTFAFYLLAQLGEPRAFEPICDFFATPGDLGADLTGDTHTEDLPAALARTFNGDIERLQVFIESPLANVYSRSSALETLGVLLQCGRLEETWVRQYVGGLLAKAIVERDDSDFTSWLVCFALDLRAPGHQAALEQCFDANLVDRSIVDRESIASDYAKSEATRWEAFRRRDRIMNVLEDMSTWSFFRAPEPVRMQLLSNKFDGKYATLAYSRRCGTVINSTRRLGRNDPCSCGSGKKHKKCCIDEADRR